MKKLIFILLFQISFGQDLTLDLKGKTLHVPSDYEQVYDDIVIKNGTIESDFPEVKELDLDDYKNEDGLYVVSKGKFKGGGAFPSIKWNGIFVNWGSIVEYKNGKWTNYNLKYGYKFKGNLIVENVTFKNIPFFLFDFIGRKTNREVLVSNSTFINTRRVFASKRNFTRERYSTLNNKTVQDGLRFNFKSFVIENSVFDTIHQAVLWGAPTIKEFKFTNNEVHNSPNLNSIANLLPITNNNPKSLAYYINNSRAEITNNIIKNCVNHSYDRTAVYRHFFRILSNSTVSNNTLENVNGIFVLVSGGGNILSHNEISGFYEPTIEAQTGWFVHKHPITGGAKNLIYKNVVTRGNQPFFVMDFSNDYDIIDNDFTHTAYISKTKDENTTWRQGKKLYYFDTDSQEWKQSNLRHSTPVMYHFDRQTPVQNLTLNSIGNKIRSHIMIRMLGEDGKYKEGQNLYIYSTNDTIQVNHVNLSKSTAKELKFINPVYK